MDINIEVITAEHLATFGGMMLVTTLVVQGLKGLLYEFFGIQGKQVKAVSFGVAFILATVIQYVFQGAELNAAGVILVLMNAFAVSVASNGFYGWFKKDDKEKGETV